MPHAFPSVAETSKQEVKEPLRIEPAKEAPSPEQSEPAPAQPNPKKPKTERPSSRFGLVNASDSEESDQEVGKAVPKAAAKKVAIDQKTDAAKTSPVQDGFTFGGNRSPEEGSRLRDFLKDAQPSLTLPKPVFSFAAPAKKALSGQKGKAGQGLPEKLPNGSSNGPAAFPVTKKSSPTAFQLPSASTDKPDTKPQKVRSSPQELETMTYSPDNQVLRDRTALIIF